VLPVRVAPPGAAVTPPPVVETETGRPLRALVVASDWHRKGGDRAVAAVRAARDAGAAVELVVVGDCPDDVPEWVVRRGRLSKDRLSDEYLDADVLLEPARVNAAGVTLTDAAAHGLPAVA